MHRLCALLLLVGVVGCATLPRLSQVRTENDPLGANDRAVLLRITYQNPLRFAHSALILEYPADPQGGRPRDLLHIQLDDRVGDKLLLLRLGAPPPSQLLVRLCASSHISSCRAGSPSPEVWITPGADQHLTYAGRIDYRLADLFPDRGTRNFLTVKEFAHREAYATDTVDAAQRWTFLHSAKFALAHVTVRDR